MHNNNHNSFNRNRNNKNNHNNHNHNNRRYKSKGRNQTVNPLRGQLDSTGPLGRVRGNAVQIAEKYSIAAKETKFSSDNVAQETLLQYEEHYNRLVIEYNLLHPNQNPNQNPNPNQNQNPNQNTGGNTASRPNRTAEDATGSNTIMGEESDDSAQPVKRRPRRPQQKHTPNSTDVTNQGSDTKEQQDTPKRNPRRTSKSSVENDDKNTVKENDNSTPKENAKITKKVPVKTIPAKDDGMQSIVSMCAEKTEAEQKERPNKKAQAKKSSVKKTRAKKSSVTKARPKTSEDSE